MSKRIDFSNRTWGIIAAVIVVLVVLIAIIKPTKRDSDLSLKSYDGTTTLTIEQVAREEEDSNGAHLARCKVDRSKNFFSTFVKKNKYFIGSIDSYGTFCEAKDNRDTGYYILLKNDHYFCLINENGYAIITELEAVVTIEGNVYFMPLPCDVKFDAGQANEIDFASMIGVSSFEDLVTYYGRIKSDYYLVDNVNKTIKVHLVEDGEITSKTLMISMAENGVVVEAYTAE